MAESNAVHADTPRSSPVAKLFGSIKASAEELFPPIWQHPAHQPKAENWQADDAAVYCGRCGITTPRVGRTQRGCYQCLNRKLPWDSVNRLSAYDLPMAGWICEMKFARQWRWGRWLGTQMAEAFGDRLRGEKTLLCPAPIHVARRIQRGFNQAEMIAIGLGQALDLPVYNALKRTRATPPQTTVVVSKRAMNVRRSIRAKRIDLTGWRVVLIDDVKTTGATLEQCARVLKQAKPSSIDVAVAAVTDVHRKA